MIRNPGKEERFVFRTLPVNVRDYVTSKEIGSRVTSSINVFSSHDLINDIYSCSVELYLGRETFGNCNIPTVYILELNTVSTLWLMVIMTDTQSVLKMTTGSFLWMSGNP